MTPHQIQSQITPYLQQKPVLRAWLFGSQAAGTADEDSDIDIMVELDYSQHIGLEFVTMWMELSELLGYEVDLVTVDGVSPFIEPYIEAQKTLIYEKQVGG